MGRAEDGTAEQRSVARLNGVPTVILEVRRQAGENTVAVVDAVNEQLRRLYAQLPADVRLEVIRDQSRYIHAALHEIKVHLVLGALLASLVVLAFMRNWQSTIIAAVAIPASLVAAFGTMYAFGFTLNSVTMLALVLMVGIVIDDAIVVLANIFRFVEEKRMRPFEAARAATADIGLAVLATTFSLVVIFLAVTFMSSISGRFLYPFGVTAAASVLVSLLVAFTLTPMMSARMIRAGDAPPGADAARPRAAASTRGWITGTPPRCGWQCAGGGRSWPWGSPWRPPGPLFFRAMAQNCWEFIRCGREPGGSRVAEQGVCPAATFEAADGYLGGTRGGRACCFVTGTLCDGVLEGTYRDKSKNCWDCSFYRALRNEYGAAFSFPAFAMYLAENDPESYRTLVEAGRQAEG